MTELVSVDKKFMSIELNDSNFEAEVLKSDQPVLVDFYAAWCGPCQMLGPIVEKLAEDYKDKPVKIAKVNVDEAPETAGKYQVMSIPTLLVFEKGEVTNTMMGLQPEEGLKELLDKLIA